jgi:hypothetical protein
VKKFILIIAFAFSCFSLVQAQDENTGRGEKRIEVLKIAFITKKLELSSDEAQRFWPVYNQYENEIRSVFRENSGDDVIENDERLLNIRKKYRPEFIKVLGQSRMNKLFSAEKDFRGVLLQTLKNRNNQQGQMLRRR